MHALEALESMGGGRGAFSAMIRGLKDDSGLVRDTALGALVRAAPSGLTNRTVLAIGAEGLHSTGDRQKWSAKLLRAAGQQAQGATLDPFIPSRGGWELVFQEATNTLRHLA